MKKLVMLALMASSIAMAEEKFAGQVFLDSQKVVPTNEAKKTEPQPQVVGKSATGEPQVTTIDENGRLKMQEAAPSTK